MDILENGANAHVTFNFSHIPSGGTLTAIVGMPHNLGRIPRGYMQTSSTNPILSLKNASTPNTANTLYLQAGSTGTVSVLVF